MRFYLYNTSFYNRLYEKNQVYDTLHKDDVNRITESVFSFFRFNEPFEEFNLKSNIEYFDYNQISHLDDVSLLLNNILLTFYISLGLLAALLLFLVLKDLPGAIRNMSIIFIISSSVMIFFLFILYLFGNNFWLLFEKFHLVFFPQGNWAFPEGSLIITIFPFGFFFDFFFRLLISSFIISTVLLISGIAGIIAAGRIKKIKKG